MIIFFYALFLMLGLSAGLIGTSLPTLTAQFAVPPDQSGLFISMHTAGAIIGLYVFGRLLDRYNSRTITWAAILCVALGLFGIWVAASLVAVFASILLFGIGFGAVIVSGNISVGRMFTTNAASPLNILNLFFGVGGILGPQVVTWALEQGQVTLAFLAISVIAAILLPFSFIPNTRPPARAVDQPKLTWTFSLWAALFPFIAFMFVYIGAEVGFSSWIYTRVINLTALDAAAASTVVSLFWIGLTSGRLVGSLLARRLNDGVILIGAACALTASVALILLFPSESIVSAIGTFAFGFAAGPMFSSVIALVGRLYPENAGQISGVILAVANIGASLIPYMQGQIGRGIDGGFIITLISAVVLIGLAVTISAQASTRRLQPAPVTAPKTR